MDQSRDLNVLGDFVLDVLKYDDIEQVANVRNMLNDRGSVGWRLNWPVDFTDDEIIAALKLLVQRGFVRIFEEDTAQSSMREPAQVNDALWNEYWYGMTDLGRSHLEEWEPPPRVGYDELS